MYRLSLFALGLAASLAGSGCTTEPGETTAIGGAAGAALGAGLGAIIGTQTGDPGSGVVIGGAAGAFAGAMVGNELEANSEKLAMHDEMARRQHETLASQKVALDELRAIDDDGSGERGARGASSSAGASREGGTTKRSGVGTGAAAAYAPGTAPSLSAPGNVARSAGPKAAPKSNDFPSRDEVKVTERKPSIQPKPVVAASSSAVKTAKPKVQAAPVTTSDSAAVTESSDAAGSKPSSIFSPVHSEQLTPATEEQSAVAADTAVASKSTSGRSPAPAYVPPSESENKPSEDKSSDAMQGEGVVNDDAGATLVEDGLSKSGIVASGEAAANHAPTEADLKDPQALEVARLAGVKDAPVATESKSSKVKASEPKSQECESAEVEAGKSGAATEVPDKLFHLRRALRLCPSNPQYHVSLGKVYLAAGRKEDAVYEFKEALKVDPSFAQATAELQSVR